MRALAFAALLAVTACKSAPEVRAEGAPPTLPQEDFIVVTQSLTQVDVKYTGVVAAGDEALTIEKAKWEFVEDGAVLRSGERPLNVAVAAGQQGNFVLEESLTYVKDDEELKAMDTRGGSLLLALRGTLVLRLETPAVGQQPAGSRVVELPFARSREVRTPRLPHLKLIDFDAGRFSEVEVQVTFHLGVVNPNPFQVSLSGLDYAVTMASKEVTKGSMGGGERVQPASTGVFDVTATLNETSHGKDAAKIVKSLVVPYVLTSTLRAHLYEETLESRGEIKLTPSK